MKHTMPGYGYYLGGDPRRFFPDAESCTEEELARHKAACEAWERGETPDPGGPHVPFGDGGHLTIAHYGLGIYEYEWDCEGAADCTECHPPTVEEREREKEEGA